jgi:hypothetical protein
MNIPFLRNDKILRHRMQRPEKKELVLFKNSFMIVALNSDLVKRKLAFEKGLVKS